MMIFYFTSGLEHMVTMLIREVQGVRVDMKQLEQTVKKFCSQHATSTVDVCLDLNLPIKSLDDYTSFKLKCEEPEYKQKLVNIWFFNLSVNRNDNVY